MGVRSNVVVFPQSSFCGFLLSTTSLFRRCESPYREQERLTDLSLRPSSLSLPLANLTTKSQAKKFVAELSPSYMTARKVLRELRAQYDILPSLPIPRRPDFSSSKGGDRESLETWKKYLEYEQGNPLDLEEAEELRMRVGLAFRKALGALRFFSEIWCVVLSTFFLLRGR